MRQYLSVIEKQKLFKNLSDENILKILEMVAIITKDFKKNEYVVKDGDEFTYAGILLEGEAIITKENSVGNRQIVTTIFEGDVFGEIFALAHSRTWLSNVVAKTNCKIMFVDLERCFEQSNYNLIFTQNIIQVFAQKCLVLNEKIELHNCKTLKSKIAKYLLRERTKNNSDTFILNINREEMAEFFNVTRPSLSRTLAELKKDMVIDYYKNSFKIVDIEKLKLCYESL